MPPSAPKSEALAQSLADSGLRSTPQREVVYEVLLKKRDHPTADEVFARVKAEMPNISLATVYNCLEVLVQRNLVRQVNFERGASRYCPNLQPHAHFYDEQTGTTHDIDLPPELMQKVAGILPSGYEAKSVEVIFRGSASPLRTETVDRTGSVRSQPADFVERAGSARAALGSPFSKS